MPDVHLREVPGGAGGDPESAAGAEKGAAETPDGTGAAQLFRAEALEQYRRGSSDEGHLLEIEPGWMRWAYRLIAALLGAALLAGFLLRRWIHV
jgi:hypothetical protein